MENKKKYRILILVVLSTPGEYYEFTVDVTNGGDTNHCALENDGTSYCY